MKIKADSKGCVGCVGYVLMLIAMIVSAKILTSAGQTDLLMLMALGYILLVISDSKIEFR